ncbi:DnaA inactivator Hda [Thalassotalea fusca]
MKQEAQLALAVQLPDDETFVSYQGKTNEHVVVQLKAFIRQMDSVKAEKMINGFYLFGQSGSGKSHLIHGSCAFAQEMGKSSICLSLNELKSLSVEVLEGLEHMDLVCLDDIHCVAGDDSWQRAIFDLYNRISERNKCLLITGNVSVPELNISLPDLHSRLSWGLVEQVKLLNDDEKMQAIQFRARQRGLYLSDEVVSFLMTRLSRDMRALLTALDQLDSASIREQRKITIPFIKSVIKL